MESIESMDMKEYYEYYYRHNINRYPTLCSSLHQIDMKNRSYPIAGFIVPYKCYEIRKQERSQSAATHDIDTSRSHL
ncbi:hypothetical protein ACF0H5_020351 [Mactra antiquata]